MLWLYHSPAQLRRHSGLCGKTCLTSAPGALGDVVLCQLLTILLPDVPHRTTARYRDSQAHLYFACPEQSTGKLCIGLNYLALWDFLSCALPLSPAPTAEQFDMTGLEAPEDWGLIPVSLRLRLRSSL